MKEGIDAQLRRGRKYAGSVSLLLVCAVSACASPRAVSLTEALRAVRPAGERCGYRLAVAPIEVRAEAARRGTAEASSSPVVPDLLGLTGDLWAAAEASACVFAAALSSANLVVWPQPCREIQEEARSSYIIILIINIMIKLIIPAIVME